LFSKILAQILLVEFPFIIFTWIILFDEPRISSMFSIKLIFLLFLVLGNIIIVRICYFLSVESGVLIIFKLLFGDNWFIKRWKDNSLSPLIVYSVSWVSILPIIVLLIIPPKSMSISLLLSTFFNVSFVMTWSRITSWSRCICVSSPLDFGIVRVIIQWLPRWTFRSTLISSRRVPFLLP